MAIHHFGPIGNLLEVDGLPDIISGSSAGSIIGAVVACNTNPELKALLQPGAIEFHALVWKKLPEFSIRGLRSLFNGQGVFDTEVLKDFIIRYSGMFASKFCSV
jgi:predicted acylesterase/phospholipase RssA